MDNDIRKIKKNTYLKIKDHYEKKYKNITIDTCQELYEEYHNFGENIKVQDNNDILKQKKLDETKDPYIKLCKDRLKVIVENINDTTDNKSYKYCYPDYNKNNFSESIIDRFEFSINPLENKEGCKEKKFNLAPYQIFLKNFISEETPYNSILIYHGTGTGKTCSAISIAENYRDIYRRKDKKIIILSPPAVKDGWRNNIYNPNKNEEQCTRDTYMNLMEKRKINKKQNIEGQQKKLIKEYYEFMGYGAFSNIIRKIIQKYGIEKSKELVNKLFSNRVLIIDEAHNIRGDIDNPSSKSSDDNIEYIRFITENTKNLKLILLTATPMYNTASEIVELINLMLSNDKKALLNTHNIFKKEKLINGEELARKANGYVSYIRGESLDKYPIRLYPTKDIIKSEKIKKLKLYECLIKGDQKKIYELAYKELKKENKLLRATEEDKLMQISNIAYPTIKKDIKYKYGAEGLKSIFSINDNFNKFTYKDKNNQIFKENKIQNYSAKIYNILNKLKTSKGIVFIYTRHVKSGIIPLMLALEQNGYKNYSNNNILNENIKDNGMKYIAITGDKDISKNNDKEIAELISEENKYGEKIKIIIGSKITSEGLNLKNIREIHVLEPWHHLKKLEQIIGRGVRYCSHENLEEHEKNVTIYLYASLIEGKDINIDIDIYSKAEKKSKEIGKVERILKQNSIDCSLFRELNKIDADEIEENQDKIELENVSVDNYKDNYKCKSNKKTKKKNMNTVNKTFLKNMYNIYSIYIKELFNKNINYTIEEIIDEIKKKIKNTNKINKQLIYLTLKNMINSKSIIENKNMKGTIIYINNYYVFQPINKKDTFLSIYDRGINKKMLTNNHINLEIKDKKKKKVDEFKKVDLKTIIDKLNLDKNRLDKEYEELKISGGKKYNFVIERLSFQEKNTILQSAIENNKISEELNDIILNHFKHNLFNKDYEFNKYTQKPVGYILFNNDEPVYIIKEKGEYITANTITQGNIIKNLKIKRKDIPKNYYTYNSKNKNNETVLKIVNYDNKKGKQTTNTCQSGNQKSEASIIIGVFKENNSELYDKYESFLKPKKKKKKDVVCNAIELLLRNKETDEMIYHLDYDNILLNKLI